MAKQSKRRTLRKSRKSQKKKGGANVALGAPIVNVPAAPVAAPAAAPVTAPAVKGGKRKTRKVSKGASDWNKKVMMVYHELKKKNPATKLGDAMKECSKRKQRGEL